MKTEGHCLESWNRKTRNTDGAGTSCAGIPHLDEIEENKWELKQEYQALLQFVNNCFKSSSSWRTLGYFFLRRSFINEEEMTVESQGMENFIDMVSSKLRETPNYSMQLATLREIEYAAR